MLNKLPRNCDLTNRLVMDARLYGPPPARGTGQNGRPRLRGAQLPTPKAMLEQRAAHIDLKIYGRHDRIRMSNTIGSVYAVPQRLLRIVAVEPLTGGRPVQAFYSTCAQAKPIEVLTWYAWRWSLEVTNRDCKQSLGFQEPQGWSRRAVERTAPTAMLLYSLIVLWLVRDGHHHYRPLARPWYTTKTEPSFADMLATLRRCSLREQVLSWGLGGQGSRNVLELLENTVA